MEVVSLDGISSDELTSEDTSLELASREEFISVESSLEITT